MEGGDVMKLNWTVRLKNKTFWLTAIPSILLLTSQILSIFGINWDSSPLTQQISSVVGTVFSLITLTGVINDPTTEGISDSAQAMTYEKPKQR